MDIGNSDAESPLDQAAKPVNHMWSPQYSPAKLAELVPVRDSLAPNNPRQSGSNAVAQDHSQHSPSDISRSIKPQGPDQRLDSHSGHMHKPPHAQAMHQHLMQGSSLAGGQSVLERNREDSYPSTGHAWSPSYQLGSVSERAPSLPPPPPSNPMHNRPHSPSHDLYAAQPPQRSMPAPSEQSWQPVHQWQANQSPEEQRMMSHHHREVAHSTAGPQHAAPVRNINHFEQQLQQSHQLPYSSTRPDTHSLSHQQHAPVQHSTHLQLNSLSQHGSVPSSDWHQHSSEPLEMHPQTYSACDATHAPDRQAQWQAHVEQGSATQGLGSRQGVHAGLMPAPHASQHDQSSQGLPATSWVQEPHPYPRHKQDLEVHIKPESGIAPPPDTTRHSVDHRFQHAPSNHQLQLQPQLQPQAATVLSPELSAALAAGVFRHSLATSSQQTAKQQEHEPAQADMRSRQPRNDVASVLPPELSAALASGQLNFHLARSDFASHSQLARQHAYEPRQAPFQHEQAPFQPGQAPFQSGQAPVQPGQAAYHEQAAYGPGQAASQPGPAVTHQPEQAAFQSEQAAHQSEQAAYQPGQAAYQSGQAAYQPEHTASQFDQAAFQHERPQASHWVMKQPHTSADPVSLTQRQRHPQLPVSIADSHQESWQTPHSAGFGGEQPLQMTMNSPTLGTHHHAHHVFAVGPNPLPASPSGLQQSAVYDQHPLHDAQHAEHRLKYPQHTPQYGQHVPEQAQHVPRQAQHIRAQTQHVPQQALHVPQQAQHVPQQAQRPPQQAQRLPQQVLQPEDHAVQQAHHVSHSRPFESTARFDSMRPQHAQHGLGDHEVQRHAGYAEHKVRHPLPTPEHLAEQQWQARGAHNGECFLLMYVVHVQ